VESLAEQARRAQLRKMPFEEYRLTPEWQTKRTQALSRAGYRCQTCGKNDVRLDVHHNTYERYGDERIFDLVVLCDRCHALFHDPMEDAS
jgi:5-methylcytosine-specific restriction endonuclease McrA